MANNYIPCETVVNIVATWPKVTRNDIERIRHIVMERYFPSTESPTDEGLEQQIGHAFQEMRYLHQYLNNNVIGDGKKIFEDEMWYLTEWLKKNRINYILEGKPLFKHEIEYLSKYFSDKLIWLIDEKKRHYDDVDSVLNNHSVSFTN